MTVKELKREINQLKTYVKRVKERLEIARENIRKISAIETRTTGKHNFNFRYSEGDIFCRTLPIAERLAALGTQDDIRSPDIDYFTAERPDFSSQYHFKSGSFSLKLFAFMQIASMSALGRRLPFGPLQYCSLRCSPSRNKSTPGVGGKECYRNRSRTLTVNWEKLVFGHSASFKNSQE